MMEERLMGIVRSVDAIYFKSTTYGNSNWVAT